MLHQLLLHRIPQRLVDDGSMLARIDGALVADLSPIQPVLQHEIQSTARLRLATPHGAIGLAM